MTRRLLLGYLAITALVLLILEVPLGVTFARRERDALVADVRRDAEATARFATGPLAGATPGRLQEVALAYRRSARGRIVVVDRRGRSVADSDEALDRDFTTRPEVAAALAGQESIGFRRSDTLGQRLLFVAVPVDPAGEVIGAVRVTYPASVVDERIRRTWLILAGVAAVALAAVAALGWWLARSIAQPLLAVEDAARRLGGGDLSARAHVPSGPIELRRLAEEVNETGARIQQLLDSQGAFVADASHQLRTPLTALRLRLEMLEGAVDASGAEDLDAAITEVQRLSRIVDGLLHIARADRQDAGAVQCLDLVAVIVDRRDAWSPVAADRDIELVARVPASAAALATPGHLEQVLDNLIANALDASPPGARIWLTVTTSDPWVEAHVADDGPGLSAERRARAFDRFSGGGKGGEGDRRGFGLGLAIAHRLVTADGGQLDLLEAPTGGLDARIRLRPSPSIPPI